VLEFRPVDDDNRAELEALRVAPRQERFVSTVAESLAEAAEHPGARALPFGIYDDGTPVGFLMIVEDVDGPPYHPYYLWKLLVDERHQRRGYGTAAIRFVAERMRARGADAFTLSAGEGDGSAIAFYERLGLVRTGEVDGDEVILRLEL
jgi:diamine N-acetyltransferase